MAQVNPGLAMTGTRADLLQAPFRSWLSIMGRLPPGIPREKALAHWQPVFRQAMREAAAGVAGLPFDSPAVRQSYLASQLRLDFGGQGLAALRRQYSKPLWILLAITGLLLLVTCANVAHLMLARADARQKEIAVRLTVGAGRLRLMRQFLTESVLLAGCGGAFGLFAAFWACQSLLTLLSQAGALRSLRVQPDTAILGFTLMVSLWTALFFGGVPAWRAARLRVEYTRTQCRSSYRSRFGKALLITQIALSLVLLTGAGLLVRSLKNLKDFDPGFNKENVLLFSVDPGTIGYKGDQVIPVDLRLLDQINRIPGVRSATFSFFSPLNAHGSTRPKVDGPTPPSVKATDAVGINEVGPSYFTTLQIPVRSGRDFSDADQAGAPKVAIINETMTRDYFGGSNPIGRQVSVPDWNGDASGRTIVGIVKDAKNSDLRELPAPMLFLPLFQSVEGAVTFEVRTALDPDRITRDVLQAVKATDSRLPVSEVKTLTEQVDRSLIQERLIASLSSLFGVLALLLAGVGLYGLMIYAVNRITKAMGVSFAQTDYQYDPARNPATRPAGSWHRRTGGSCGSPVHPKRAVRAEACRPRNAPHGRFPPGKLGRVRGLPPGPASLACGADGSSSNGVIVRKKSLILLSAAVLFQALAVAADYNLGELAKSHQMELFHRTLDQAKAEAPEVAFLSSGANYGLAWISGLDFLNGTIELEIKGRNKPGQSFVGIAFHGQDDRTFDAVYLRPFHFQAADAEHRRHSIQYIPLPQYDWSDLRKKYPGQYESALIPAPAPKSWVRLKLIIDKDRVSAFVNGADKPALNVQLRNNRHGGKLGLWVGNGSDGWFKSLKISPVSNEKRPGETR